MRAWTPNSTALDFSPNLHHSPLFLELDTNASDMAQTGAPLDSIRIIISKPISTKYHESGSKHGRSNRMKDRGRGGGDRGTSQGPDSSELGRAAFRFF
jgi:hypothetical protein